MREIKVRDLAYIPLGRQGENNAQKVIWPGVADSWARLYGKGVFALKVQRQGDDAMYLANVTSENGDIVWVLSNADTAKVGDGVAILEYRVGSTVAKSRAWRTVTEWSPGDETAEPPEAYQSWVDKVLAAGATAEAAVSKLPYVGENGNWWRWDGSAEAFVDTGTSARGTKGEKGDTGATGPAGPKGETGAQGEKGEVGPAGQTGPAGPTGATGATGPAGPAGPQGPKGDTGAQGPAGETGPRGPQGPAGKDGETPELVEGELVEVPSGGGGSSGKDGVTFTPSVSADGDLSWSNDGGLDNPETVNIKGPRGDTGSPGAKGDTGTTPNIQIGTVTTLDAGEDATASITGTPENPLLNLGIPKGADGGGGSGTGTGGTWTLLHEQTLNEAVETFSYDLDAVRAAAIVVFPGGEVEAGWKRAILNDMQVPISNRKVYSFGGVAFVVDLDAPIKVQSVTNSPANMLSTYGTTAAISTSINAENISSINKIGIATGTLLVAGAKILIYAKE